MQIWCVTSWVPSINETTKLQTFYADERRALHEAKWIEEDPRIEVRIKPVELIGAEASAPWWKRLFR